MGIVQENRFNAPKPEINETEYGATFITAATESPVNEVVNLDGDNGDDEKDVEEPAVDIAEEKAEDAPAAEKKKAGRPKKSNKKK